MARGLQHSMRSTKIRLRYIILILFLGCAFFFMCMLYIYQTNHNFETELYNYLNDISVRDSEIMELKIDNNLHVMKEASKSLYHKSLDTKEKVISQLKQLDPGIEYSRMSYADANGHSYTKNGKEMDVSNTSFFQKAMKGEATISNAELNENVKEKETVYALPIFEDTKVCGVLLITQKKECLVNTLSMGNQEETIYTAIIDENGNFVTTGVDWSQELDGFEDKDHFEMMHQENLYRYESKTGQAFLLHFQPFAYNGWHTVSMISADIITNRTRNANILAFAFSIIILSTVLFIVYQVIHNHRISKKELERIASYDDVTESDNYTAFLSVTKQWLKQTSRKGWCIVHCDIKDFNIINSLLGYIEGDHLLKNVFDMIHQDLKEEERCVRVEADRFVILWQMDDIELIKKRIEFIDHQICESFITKSYHEELLLYYGVYVIKESDIAFVKCIDKAKYCKKYCKPDQKIMIYEDSMYENRMKERKMENRMYHALGNDEFKVYLQPKVDTRAGNKIVSAEALIRWQDPTLGEIYPSEFIPLFERNGFLEHLDFYTFDIVCMSLAKWNREIDPNLSVSFNISRSYIFNEHFVKHLTDITDTYGVNRHNVEIEIVESMIFEKPEKLLGVIQELIAQGFQIAMDDFGSGYSSLSMLKQIPFDIIKIDQGFFKTEEHNEEKGKAIVDIIIRLAQILHVEVVTEGIETKEQLDFVKKAGCHVIQGYYFYKPMKLEEFNKLIELEDGFDKTELSKQIKERG